MPSPKLTTYTHLKKADHPAAESQLIPYEQQPATSQIFELTQGFNPLVTAAAPLLYVLPELRAGVVMQNPAQWQSFLVKELQALEQHLVLQDYSHHLVLAARYLLCTAIDEVICHSSPEAVEQWPAYALSLAAMNENYVPERFPELLQQLTQRPQLQADMQELLYLTLSIGFDGYENFTDETIQLNQLEQQIYHQIRQQHGEYEQRLAISVNSTIVREDAKAKIVPDIFLSFKRALFITVGALSLFYASSLWLTYQFITPVTDTVSQITNKLENR